MYLCFQPLHRDREHSVVLPHILHQSSLVHVYVSHTQTLFLTGKGNYKCPFSEETGQRIVSLRVLQKTSEQRTYRHTNIHSRMIEQSSYHQLQHA